MELKFRLAANGEHYECIGIEPEDYTGPVTIPGEWEGLPVQLGTRAFAGCGVTSVHLPAGITRIPLSCFNGCRNLSEVTFEEGSRLERIDQSAFAWCTKGLRIRFPESLKDIGLWAFERARVDLQIPGSCSVASNALEDISGKFRLYECPGSPANRDECGNHFCLNKDGASYTILELGWSGRVPESFKGLPVTWLADGFCSRRDDVKWCYVPATVKGGGDMPFCGCDYMEEIGYGGTMEEWERTGIYFWGSVHCSDGTIDNGGHESL